MTPGSTERARCHLSSPKVLHRNPRGHLKRPVRWHDLLLVRLPQYVSNNGVDDASGIGSVSGAVQRERESHGTRVSRGHLGRGRRLSRPGFVSYPPRRCWARPCHYPLRFRCLFFCAPFSPPIIITAKRVECAGGLREIVFRSTSSRGLGCGVQERGRVERLTRRASSCFGTARAERQDVCLRRSPFKRERVALPSWSR